MIMPEVIKIKIDELVFDCRVAGNPNDELIMFLHGFPETSYMWRNMIQDLSESGFYCVAPNMRGFSESACPKGKKNYHLDLLASDVLAIAEKLDKPKFHLVGHDWGSLIGWKTVHENPDTILSWSALSFPHVKSFLQALKEDPEQRKKSSYFSTIVFPFLPEMSMRKDDFRIFRKLWIDSSEDEVENYLSVFRNPRQLTAAVNYYRFNIPYLKNLDVNYLLDKIHTPTLFICGKKDGAIGAFAVKNSHQYMKGPYQYLELDTGHWLVQTKYDEVKNAIMQHVLMFRGK